MAEADSPRVLVRPPVLYIAVLIAALALGWIRPLPILESTSMALWAGVALCALAIAVLIPGRRALESAGTNVNPALPTTAIVTSGLYRFSRNPLYVGLTLLYLGVILAFNTWWGILLLVPLLVTMHWGVVLREERYLAQKFGDTYGAYRSTVRRYL